MFRRLIFAFSAITRGNVNCVEKFKVLGGFKILQKSLEDRIAETDLVLKGLSFISDLLGMSKIYLKISPLDGDCPIHTTSAQIEHPA